MPNINEQLASYTQTLKLVQGIIGIAFPLGGQIIGLVQAAIAAGGGDQKTLDEAKAAVAAFQAETKATKDFIQNWQATHPPLPDPRG